MKLHINNIGKIKEADIELNGITLICGENNTGKSTTGKVLMCIFNSCYKIDETLLSQISIKMFWRIEQTIRNYVKNKALNTDADTIGGLNEEIWKSVSVKKIIELIQSISSDSKQGRKDVEAFLLNNMLPYYADHACTDYLIKKVYNIIIETRDTPIVTVKKSRIRNGFNIVFDNQFINTEDNDAYVEADIKGNIFSASFNENECTDLKLDFEFTNHAIFIDSPDEYKDELSNWERRKYTLEKLVVDNSDKDEDMMSDIDRVDIEQKTLAVSKVLDKAIKGKIKSDSTNAKGGFQFAGSKTPISIANLSTGVKSLLLFKTLCESGKLSEKDVLILDEPEIHMHPEWQLVYAEAIVLLQKEFNLTVLITTHSPYFLEAIDVYSKKYDRKSIVNYYLAENDNNNNSKIKNVTGHLNEIYKKMYNPLKKLENEEV